MCLCTCTLARGSLYAHARVYSRGTMVWPLRRIASESHHKAIGSIPKHVVDLALCPCASGTGVNAILLRDQGYEGSVG